MPTVESNLKTSKQPIDVLIPAIEKDLANLPYVIDGIRRMVKHPIGTIYIVSPKSKAIEQLCKLKECRFVHENTVLPITKKDIDYHSGSWDRSGWLFQQLLKLSGDTICSNDRFLVIDADTVLLRPHVFRSGSKTVFYYRKWSQPEYFRAYRKLLGKPASAPVSFVAHYMLFEKSRLKRLKAALEARHQVPWHTAILKNINKSKMCAFSEFETYGNFIYSKDPGKFIFKKTLNKSMAADAKQLSPLQMKALAQTYRSLSIHKRKSYYIK